MYKGTQRVQKRAFDCSGDRITGSCEPPEIGTKEPNIGPLKGVTSALDHCATSPVPALFLL